MLWGEQIGYNYKGVYGVTPVPLYTVVWQTLFKIYFWTGYRLVTNMSMNGHVVCTKPNKIIMYHICTTYVKNFD